MRLLLSCMPRLIFWLVRLPPLVIAKWMSLRTEGAAVVWASNSRYGIRSWLLDIALEVAPAPVDTATLREHLSQTAGLLELDPLGHHWIKVWNFLRDRELFDPWFQRLASNLRRGRESRLDPAIIHQKTVDMFKCREIFADISQAHLEYDCAGGVSQLARGVGYIEACVPLERWRSELLQLFDDAHAPS